MGDYSGAARLLEQALGIFHGLGDQHGEAEALNEQGRCTGLVMISPALSDATSRP